MESISDITIAVAIPTLNREDVLIDTINDVLNQDLPATEILVIDQTFKHAEHVEELLFKLDRDGLIRYIKHYPPGLPGARNRALRETNCDVLVFIDDDVILGPGFFRAHKRNYLDNPRVVAVAGRVDQRLGWPELRKRPNDWPRALDFKFLRLDSRERIEGIANFMGGNHSVRVGYALGLNGFDENFRGVGLREDTDMALRIYSAGGLIVFDPAASLFHLAVKSGGCRKKNHLDTSGGECVLRFALKHRKKLGKYLFHEIWHSLRISIFSKKMLKNFWLIPIAAMRLAWQSFNIVRRK